MYKAEEDGITHINCYSKGATRLGRLLSNFAHSPFEIAGVAYASMEARWFELCTPNASPANHAVLRSQHGFSAKQTGKRLRDLEGCQVDTASAEFQLQVRQSLKCKLRFTCVKGGQFERSTLPLAHYYVYGPKVVPAGHQWLIGMLEDLRREFPEDLW